MTVARSAFRRITRVDEWSSPAWLDNDGEVERRDAYDHGDWHLIGIQAAATFLIPLGNTFVIQTITSPGLWGIESGSDGRYLDEVFADECDNLAVMLAALGVWVTA